MGSTYKMIMTKIWKWHCLNFLRFEFRLHTTLDLTLRLRSTFTGGVTGRLLQLLLARGVLAGDILRCVLRHTATVTIISWRGTGHT